MYYLSVRCQSCCFYIQYYGGIRDITSMPVQIFCFILCSILLTQWRNTRLFYSTIQKRSLFEPALPPHSPLFVVTPLGIILLRTFETKLKWDQFSCFIDDSLSISPPTLQCTIFHSLFITRCKITRYSLQNWLVNRWKFTP